MGTNYYFHIKECLDTDEAYSTLIKSNRTSVLESYVREGFHVGKSSAGWRFIFAKNDEYKNFEELKTFYSENSDIFDLYTEYMDIIIFDEFLEFVEIKQNLQPDSYCELHEDGTVWNDREFS